jgi:hypothetical protein
MCQLCWGLTLSRLRLPCNLGLFPCGICYGLLTQLHLLIRLMTYVLCTMRVLKNQYVRKKNKKTWTYNPTNLVVINPTPENLNPRLPRTLTLGTTRHQHTSTWVISIIQWGGLLDWELWYYGIQIWKFEKGQKWRWRENAWPSRLTFNCVGEKIPLYNAVSSESIISLARHGGSFTSACRERENLFVFFAIVHVDPPSSIKLVHCGGWRE